MRLDDFMAFSIYFKFFQLHQNSATLAPVPIAPLPPSPFSTLPNHKPTLVPNPNSTLTLTQP